MYLKHLKETKMISVFDIRIIIVQLSRSKTDLLNVELKDASLSILLVISRL